VRSKDPVNIALVILHADPARGGAERYTVDLAAALARRGHDVSLLASTHAADLALSGVRPVKIAAYGLGRQMQYGCFLAALNDELEQSHYDVVHAMLPVDRCDVYHPHAGMAAAAAQKWNVAFNPRRRMMARTERKLLIGPNAPITIALSEYVKRSILEHYPIQPDRLATLFNAVDLHRFEPAPRPYHDYVNGLFIGQDFERKGLGRALAAASMLKEPRLKITIVGKRDARFPVPPDPGGQFSFAGEVPDPRPFYADADFFVLPTKHDPCSLVVLEALAMGVPVISTTFNGATEIMTDGVHGYVLKDATDVAGLAEAMRKMLDPERRRAMSAACLALRPRLSYEHHLDELMKIYDRVIASRATLR
jgi:UDP-glucose:(heptosyl)LPS alpha-1,3-glucosyltransferase